MPVRAAFTYTRHAYDRMSERGIGREDIEAIVKGGEVIEEYADDTPFPSKLFFGQFAGRALHVAAAWDHNREEWVVITAYEPDLVKWGPGFRKRRR